jgi:hypothetical protein
MEEYIVEIKGLDQLTQDFKHIKIRNFYDKEKAEDYYIEECSKLANDWDLIYKEQEEDYIEKQYSNGKYTFILVFYKTI